MKRVNSPASGSIAGHGEGTRCAVDPDDGVPGCGSGPSARIRFVAREVRDILHRRQSAPRAGAGRADGNR